DFHVTGVQTCALPIWGNWAKRLPSISSRWVDEVNSGNSGDGVHRAPEANMRAWTTWMISSISSGRPEKTNQEMAAASVSAMTPRSEERRVGKEDRVGG